MEVGSTCFLSRVTPEAGGTEARQQFNIQAVGMSAVTSEARMLVGVPLVNLPTTGMWEER